MNTLVHADADPLQSQAIVPCGNQFSGNGAHTQSVGDTSLGQAKWFAHSSPASEVGAPVSEACVGQRAIPTLQPVLDVVGYLAERKPQPDPDREHALFIALPSEQREEVTALRSACLRVLSRLTDMSVTRAVAEVIAQPNFAKRHWKTKTFRALFDEYHRTQDWVCLVNRSKCNALWRSNSVGLPLAFLHFCARRFGEFRREDGKRQAVMSIKRQWKTGRNDQGEEEVIPGYEAIWTKRNRELIPGGWHYSNILRQIKRNGTFTKAVRAFLHEGESTARQFLPQQLGTRRGLRFLEKITFDDVRTDWLVFNTKTGAHEELWLLIARDEATAMILGFVMHPATVREDGSAAHLGLKQMKQLAGWLLERYPLPPYVVTWVVERGTSTLSEGMRAALGELFGNRIRFTVTSMIGSSSSPAGYREKKKGNSRGKASHESHNRLLHTQGANLPGQTGARWDIRPADLNARTAECAEIWELRGRLPAELQGREKYPLLTLQQARANLFRICHDQNSRTEHKLEDFDEVLEWFDGQRWQPQQTFKAESGIQIRKRMEMPIERAARLARGYEWTHVSPEIVAAFYEHSEKLERVEDNGEIRFEFEGKILRFVHGGIPLVPGTKVLAYFHPDDPKFLHLTDGRGAVLGTWIRRERVGFRDTDALAEAMRYTSIAREAAREAANTLAAPQRAELEAMRAHNEELLKLAEFTDITEAPTEKIEDGRLKIVGAPVGAALTAVSAAVKTDLNRSTKQATAEAVAAAEDIFRAVKSPAATMETDPEDSDAAAAAADVIAAIRKCSQ